MKRLIFLAFMQLCFLSAFSQNYVTLNFVRSKNATGLFSPVNILVNNQAVGSLSNGAVFNYKLGPISDNNPVLVAVTSSIYTKSITVTANNSEYFFETGFENGEVYLLAIDNDAFQKQLLLLKSSQETAENVSRNLNESNKSLSEEGSKTVFDYNKKDKSLKIESEQQLNSESIRQQWLEKGGKLKGTYFVGGASLLYKDMGDTEMNGYGLNVAFGQNFFNLKVPEYSTRRASWSSLQVGYGLSGSYNYTSVQNVWGDVDFDPIESSFTNLALNLNLGLVFGSGIFLDQTNWKGLTVELNYKPSMVIGIPEEGDSSTDYNFTGFSVDFNTSNFTSTMNKIAPKAQYKFSIFVLPPVGDMPFFMSISLGAIWYSK